MKKIGAIITTVIIALVWVITAIGIGPVGPIQDKIKLGLDISGGVYVVLEAETEEIGPALTELMEQTQAVIEQRVNEMGLSEPVVTIEGAKRIRVELPGVENPEEAIQTIGTTAKLQFKLADGTVVIEGNEVSGSTVRQDTDHGGYLITLEFTDKGAQDFFDATTKAYNREPQEPFFASEITDANAIAIVLDDEILSAPSVDNGPISGGSAVITRSGGFDQAYAIQISTLIRAGALPVDLKEVESSAIGATLGMGALQNTLLGGLIGLVLVFILMISLYRFMGVGASLALLLYVPLIPWILVGLGGVLTLPGIAGVILSVGMAVDANVIIFERIKDEVAEGKSIRVAVASGFKKAIGTVLDAQITTLIAGVVLYQFGTGPVRGFALTLIIGILVSLFTALSLTNIYVRVFSESKLLVKRGMLGLRESHGTASRRKWSFNFIQHRKLFYIITVVILIAGFGLGIGRGFNLGIDFTGGTMLQFDLGKSVSTEEVRSTLAKNDITDAEIVAFGDQSEGVIIKTTRAVTSAEREEILASFEADFGVEADALQTFEQFGPSVGKMLTNNAIKAVLISIALMLVYIVIRFRLHLGIAAIITTFHDAIIMIAMYGLFNMTINNPFIAAILTVVGYSINDTIVIFDRIRENLGGMRRQPLPEIIDTSVNQTLARSITTSLTTILAILPLIFIGGETIRQFAVPLMIGIIAGTLSSIFIASPLFYDLSKGSYKAGKGKYKGAEKAGKPEKPSKQKPDGNGAVV